VAPPLSVAAVKEASRTLGDLFALKISRRTRVLELLIAGGWVMWPILLCSALALAIIIERFWSLRRSKVLPLDLGDEVRQWAASGRLDPKHIETLRVNSPLGAILSAALEVRHRPREQIKERVEDVGRHQMHRMERFLNTLGTISTISPLLGSPGHSVRHDRDVSGLADARRG
jgi:biopolymer transport protein ExbB